MFQQILGQLDIARARYGEQQQPPCMDDQLQQLRRRVRDEFGAELPDEYIAFLRTQNGLNYNGLFIYASQAAPVVGVSSATIQGLVEANLAWRNDESFVSYLIFGDGNMDIYVRHLPTGDYQVRDRVPGNLIETYSSFNHLLAAAIQSHL